MKSVAKIAGCALVNAAVGGWVAAQGGSAVTHATHDKVAGCGKPVPIVSSTDHRVSCQVRTAAGEVEVHVKEIDVFYITDGAATFVTGGRLVDADTSNALQIKAKSIEGGEIRELAKGDVIVIPAGVPHWFKSVPGSISMLSTKVIKP